MLMFAVNAFAFALSVLGLILGIRDLRRHYIVYREDKQKLAEAVKTVNVEMTIEASKAAKELQRLMQPRSGPTTVGDVVDMAKAVRGFQRLTSPQSTASHQDVPPVRVLQREQHRRNLFHALKTRVLTDEEMLEALIYGNDLMLEPDVVYTAFAVKYKIDRAFRLQDELRKTAGTKSV